MSRATTHEIRLGLITARIVSRRSGSASQYTVRVTRRYRDGDTWKTSARFSGGDLPLLKLVIDQAHTWILQQAMKVKS